MEKYVDELLEKIVRSVSKPKILEIYRKIEEINLDSEEELRSFIDNKVELEE
ncbi:MAG: hypothetical protein P8Y97_03255 [Candidatus Lokiarchaeota archaeon]